MSMLCPNGTLACRALRMGPRDVTRTSFGRYWRLSERLHLYSVVVARNSQRRRLGKRLRRRAEQLYVVPAGLCLRPSSG
jgi:hypothetical protein